MSIKFLPSDSNIRSTNGGSSKVFHVENKTSGIIEVYWIDHNGRPVSYGSLIPNGNTQFHTNTNHPWLIKTERSETKFFPDYTGIKGTITVTDSSFSFDSVKEKVNGKWSTFWGHGIPDVAKALGINNFSTPLVETPLNNHAILNKLNVPAAWNAGFKGEGVKVAILDGGILNHPEISNIVHRYNVATNSSDTNPTVNGQWTAHGIGVASVVAAKYDMEKYEGNTQPVRDITGVAPEAEILDIRITMPTGNSSNTSIVKGIEHAISQGAKVIQISQGSTNSLIDKDILGAVKKAYDNNILVVWAGGNNGTESPTGLSTTSLMDISISVGNYDFLTGTPHVSSNLAGTMKHPYVFAPSNGYYPGENGSYNHLIDAGTSFSSPYVAGMAALLFQKFPNASTHEIIDLIVGSSWIPSLGREVEFDSSGNRVISLESLKAGTQTVIGTVATDILIVDGPSYDYGIRHDLNSTKMLLIAGNHQFNVSGVDRIKFEDKALAFDMHGAAGDALEIMYALTQDIFFDDPGIAGLLLRMLDTQDRNEVVEFAALNVLGPNWNGHQLIAATVQNIYGVDPSSGIVDILRNTGSQSDIDLFWSLVESPAAQDLIHLVGIQEHGWLEYTA